jgi:hypothetical protein
VAKKKKLRPYEPPPPAEPISVDRAVEEGLLIARSALTMDVKNHIIVWTLRDDHRFDATQIATVARAELAKLIDEYGGDARRMDSTAVTAISATGPQTSGHDYRAVDYWTLSKRAMIYAAMSAELTRLSADDEFVDAIVEEARTRAWSELSAIVEGHLDWVGPPPSDSDYEETREERMLLLRTEDLRALAMQNFTPGGLDQ